MKLVRFSVFNHTRII